MDVTYDRLIDIGLNLLAYLLAAGLGIVIYSLKNNRRRPQVTAQEAVPELKAPTPEPPVDNRRFQFLDLTSSNSSGGSQKEAGSFRSVSGRAGRRDRVEIIRLAREMMKKNTSHDTIKRTLAIADGELALLQTEK
ncbi:MAG: hypothetical protein DRP45_05330 [Candidatus Zixiibacteriota bacterium]|nr:MAG: hypothetical protein DRP45_05330 [candidate division Zixibacteria bacterium]